MADPHEIAQKTLARKSTTNALDYGKLPPQNKELEEAVLGAVMIDKNAILNIAELFKPEVFYVDAHQRIAKAIKELYEARNPIDSLTVVEVLKKNGDLENAGGPFYVAQLTGKIGSSAHIEYHMRVVIEKYIARMLVSSGTEQIRDAYEDQTDVFELLNRCHKAFIAIEQIAHTGATENTASIVDAALVRMEAGNSAVPSSHSAINKNLFGWKKGNMVVVAARTGMGKTAFHVSELVNLCLAGVKCASFNLEMMPEQFIIRGACNISEVVNTKYRLKVMNKKEEENFYLGIEQIRQFKNLHLDFTSGITVSQIRAKIRKWKFEHGLEVVFIDHLQFISPEDSKGKNRDIQIGEITRELKAIAKEEEVCIILFCHISRQAEKNANKRPTLAELRESGNIENDADSVIFLVRPEYYFEKTSDGRVKYNGPEEEAFKNICQVFCDKNRDGFTFETEWNCHLGISKFKDVIDEMRGIGKKTEEAQAVTDTPQVADDDTPF